MQIKPRTILFYIRYTLLISEKLQNQLTRNQKFTSINYFKKYDDLKTRMGFVDLEESKLRSIFQEIKTAYFDFIGKKEISPFTHKLFVIVHKKR